MIRFKFESCRMKWRKEPWEKDETRIWKLIQGVGALNPNCMHGSFLRALQRKAMNRRERERGVVFVIPEISDWSSCKREGDET